MSERTAPPADESGVYVLRAVDGAPLPFCQLVDGADTLEIAADTLIVAAPATVTEVRWLTQRGPIVPPSENAPSVRGRAGLYKRAGAHIDLYFNKTATIVGSVSRRGDTLALRYGTPDSGQVWLFTR